MPVLHFRKPFLHRSVLQRCHLEPFPLTFKSQGHCEWYSFSFATISVVTHVITDFSSRTQAKDQPIEYSFQRFDEQHHSNSLKPRNSSCQLCPDWRPFEFALQGYSCGIPDAGASNVEKLGYEASVMSCSPSLFNDANALSPWIH